MSSDKNPIYDLKEFANINESGSHLPAHPYLGFDNSDEIEKDLNYMNRLYSQEVTVISKEVVEECDKMEFNGSPMYDAYPDKTYLRLVSDRIYDKISGNSPDASDVSAVHLTHFGFFPPRQCRGSRCNENPWARNLIDVLLLNEILNRRRRYRSYRRFF